MTKNLRFTLILWLLLLSVQSVLAQVKGNPELKAPAPQQPAIEKSPSKLSTDLQKLYDSFERTGKRNDGQIKPKLSHDELYKYIQVKGDQVLVDVTIKGEESAAKAELEKLGFKVIAHFGRVVSGMIPIKSLPQLETATQVKFVRPAYKPLHQSRPLNTPNYQDKQEGKPRPVISQGDTAQRSYIARRKYLVDGKGVKVGILSDSYNNLGTAESGVLKGELPGPKNPFHYKKPVQVLKDLDSNGSDEGRAMAEIIHDVAPGAELAFRTAFLGQADFAQGILDLAAAGCKVITDDVIYFAEPFFQDGIIAQAVDMVKQKGVTYFSSAGNRSVRSYESEYRASTVTPFGPDFGTAHNFSAPSDAPRFFQPIFIPAGGTFIASFQWDQPFFSVGGAGASSDLDIYLLNAQGEIVAAGASDNLASGDPLELFGYTNTTPSTTFFLAILKYSGPDPSRLKYILYGSGAFFLTTPPIPGILAPTIVGHAKAEGAIATAAAFYLETPAYGVDTPRVEPFSSVGGVPHYFDTKGNRITPIVRKKPEITAPDGANTSFFDPFGDGDIVEDRDTFPNFFGTSAAAPHAAGVAALMIDAQKWRTLTPEQIKGILSVHTVDMDNIYTSGFDQGFDFNTGTGLIKADAAVAEVRFPNVYVKNLQVKAACSDDPATVRNWKISNPNPFAVKVHWRLVGFSQQGTLIVSPGETIVTTKTAYYHNRSVPNIMLINWEDNLRIPRFYTAYSTTASCGNYVSTEPNSGESVAKESEAVTEQSNIAEVFLNPSPAHFKLYLSLINQQNATIELFTANGAKLWERIVPATGVIDIDASGYQPGVYMLSIKQGSFNKVFRLVKQ